jgi:hypothetical protein
MDINCIKNISGIQIFVNGEEIGTVKNFEGQDKFINLVNRADSNSEVISEVSKSLFDVVNLIDESESGKTAVTESIKDKCEETAKKIVSIKMEGLRDGSYI